MREHAVLAAALHDVARLDEDVLAAGVLDLELVDLARLDDADAALVERLLQRQRHRSRRARTVNEIDGEVLVNVRAGDAILVVGEGKARRQRDGAQNRKTRCGQRKHLHDKPFPD